MLSKALSNTGLKVKQNSLHSQPARHVFCDLLLSSPALPPLYPPSSTLLHKYACSLFMSFCLKPWLGWLSKKITLKMVRAGFGLETPPSFFLRKTKWTTGQGELCSVLPPYPSCIESWPAQGQGRLMHLDLLVGAHPRPEDSFKWRIHYT